jgi:hypothetical protein
VFGSYRRLSFTLSRHFKIRNVNPMRKGIVFSFLNRFRPDCRERDESVQVYFWDRNEMFCRGPARILQALQAG